MVRRHWALPALLVLIVVVFCARWAFVPEAPRRALPALLLVASAPAHAIKGKEDDEMANMDKLGSMLEKKWDKVKPRCTSLKMTGIKAGYGVSKKKELEDTVVCDDGGKPEDSKDRSD
mmetsp:Transcript_3716/g.4293  ORF Transcript_3716/g.4293 Transcript_3716/m.4293 type:complete len:118 (-) Transcript_3716:35-388(-)